jgi:hypothetical protein
MNFSNIMDIYALKKAAFSLKTDKLAVFFQWQTY